MVINFTFDEQFGLVHVGHRELEERRTVNKKLVVINFTFDKQFGLVDVGHRELEERRTVNKMWEMYTLSPPLSMGINTIQT